MARDERGSMVMVSSLEMSLKTLTEQGEQQSFSQGLQTLQGVKLANMHSHQDGCCY